MSRQLTMMIPVNVTDSAGNHSAISQNVIVGVTCGVLITSGDMMSFGTMLPEDIRAEQAMVLHNTGNTNGTLSLHGTHWMNNGTAKMDVGSTRYSVSPNISYDSKTSLGITPTNTQGIITPDDTPNMFWQIQASLVDSLFAGDLEQTIVVSLRC